MLNSKFFSNFLLNFQTILSVAFQIKRDSVNFFQFNLNINKRLFWTTFDICFKKSLLSRLKNYWIPLNFNLFLLYFKLQFCILFAVSNSNNSHFSFEVLKKSCGPSGTLQQVSPEMSFISWILIMWWGQKESAEY